MQPVPIGVPGEIYAAGDGLSRAYHNRPELNEDRFTDMLRDCIRLVADARKAGKSIEDMKKENVLAKHDALGHDFVKTPVFIEQIAKELAGAAPSAPSSSAHH